MDERTRWQRFLGYFAFTALSAVTVFAGLRLDQADLNVPLAYHGDVLLILPMVKSTVETGTHWHNDRLGAPGIQELHDFPVVDHLHFAILWLLGQFAGPVAAFNLYYIAGYPLATLTTMIVLRSYRVSFAAAGLAGMLYAFLQYHAVRGLGHYFLSAYWTLPLSLWPALALLHGQTPLMNGRRLGWLLGAVMTACAGAYYAFFTCATLAYCGVFAAVAFRTWKPVVSVTLLVAVIVGVGVVNHLPAILYQSRNGPNTEVTKRQPEEAEEYGLKLAQMLLPIQHHRWKPLADLRSKYDSSFRIAQNENGTSTLGTIGALTLITAIISLFVALARGTSRTPSIAIASLILFLLLYGSSGGGGSLFNFLVSAQVRSVNRISIVIAFFVFALLAINVDRFVSSRMLGMVCNLLIIVGVFDETSRQWFRSWQEPYQAIRVSWENDAHDTRLIEEAAGDEPVFCLPFIAYPETLRVGTLSGYDHTRLFVHSSLLRISFGAMKGREEDTWQREVACQPPAAMVERLVYRGFGGVFINLDGFDGRIGADLCENLEQTLKTKTFLFKNPGWRYYSLLPMRERLRTEQGGTFDRRCREERERVSILWLDGFVSFESLGQENQHRWCGRYGTMMLVNPSSMSRTLTVSMIMRSSTSAAGQLVIDGGSVWSETMTISNSSPVIERTWIVPPGRHEARFSYAPPREHVPQDSRDNVFFIANFVVKESRDSR